jgi:hypothetical protein
MRSWRGLGSSCSSDSASAARACVSFARVTRTGVAAGLIVGAWASSAPAQVAPPAPETIAIGDWQLAPMAEVRVRGEYSRDLDDLDRGFLLERTRLGVDVQREAVQGRVVLQDAHVWNVAAGMDPVQRRAPIALTGAYEAWVEAHTATARPMFVRIGRQPVTWGEGRLLGAADWSPTGRSLDALRGRLQVADAAFELLAASLSDPTSAGLTAYGELFGARGQWALHPLFALEAYVLARLVQESPSPDITALTARGQTYTGALRLYGEGFAWAWGVEGASQLGRAEDLKEDRVAWAVAGHVAHRFERVVLLPTVGLGLAYASGDDGGSTYRAFDPLLPDVHVWHGAMDLLSWSNEQEASARVAVVPWTDAVAAIEYRYARLAEARGAWRTASLATVGVGSVPSNTQQELGHEIDAVLTGSPWVPVELTAGYSMLILGDGARAILRAANITPPALSHFAYAQVAFRMP